MAENKNMVAENLTPPEQKEKRITWAKFGAGLKERCRKTIVNLKRRPSNIAFLVLIVTSLYYLIAYTNIAKMLYDEQTSQYIEWSGLCSFVTFLFSILVLLLFMNSFPKRKKVNVVMLVLTFVFIGIMIAMNSICYVEICNDINAAVANNTTVASYFYTSQTIYIAHIVLLAVSAVFIACTPLFKMGLMKINTRKDLGDTEFKGQIDLENVEE